MSLKTVHILFVVLSTALALGMVLWCVERYRADGSAGMLIGAVASGVSAAMLAGYGVHVYGRLRRLPVGVIRGRATNFPIERGVR